MKAQAEQQSGGQGQRLRPLVVEPLLAKRDESQHGASVAWVAYLCCEFKKWIIFYLDVIFLSIIFMSVQKLEYIDLRFGL